MRELPDDGAVVQVAPATPEGLEAGLVVALARQEPAHLGYPQQRLGQRRWRRGGCPSDFRIISGKHGQTWAGAPCVGRTWSSPAAAERRRHSE